MIRCRCCGRQNLSCTKECRREEVPRANLFHRSPYSYRLQTGVWKGIPTRLESLACRYKLIPAIGSGDPRRILELGLVRYVLASHRNSACTPQLIVQKQQPLRERKKKDRRKKKAERRKKKEERKKTKRFVSQNVPRGKRTSNNYINVLPARYKILLF